MGKNFRVFKFSIQQLWNSIIIIFKLFLILTTSELSCTMNIQWQQEHDTMRIKHSTKENFETKPEVKPKNSAMSYKNSHCGLSECKT